MSCITLLSDLGLQDASVAVAKGVLMQHTSLPVADISHEVKQYNLQQAAYLLGTVYHRFPEGSIHVPLFGIYAASPARLVLCEYKDHYFLAPDNGLIPMALGATPAAWLCHQVQQQDTYSSWLHNAGTAISKLQQQPAANAGYESYTLINTTRMPQPALSGDTAECQVIHIDHYENIVTNMTQERFNELSAGRRFTLQFMLTEEINEISTGYHEVRQGYKLCRFNSHGYMEICINHGRAASLFGLRLGSALNDIKIIFE